MMIYGNLPSALQAEAIGAAVYILNLILSDALDGNFLRHVIDTALGRAINDKKLLLNMLRTYRATTIVYNYDVPRRAKFNKRGQRRQLVGYEDSIYRVQVPLLYKVIRSLYYQFVKDGKLIEILGTKASFAKELDQQFEYNVVEARGKPLEVPTSYTIETVPNDSVYEVNEDITRDSIAESNVLKAVDDTTELP